MQKIIILFVLAFSLSFCNQKDEPPFEPAFQLNIGQESIKLDESYILVNENCNSIYATVTTSAGGTSSTQFRIEFVLTKSGLINKVSFYDYSDGSKNFSTVDFQPSKTFSINNFTTTATSLAFDFEGELYQVNSSSNHSISLNGSVNYKKYTSIACSFYPWTLTSSFDEDNLNATEQIINQTFTNQIQYIYFTQDGFRFTIYAKELLEQKATRTYSFDETSNFKIILQKYIGKKLKII